MPEVAFHLNVGGVQAYACRLLRKAHQKGARVFVLGDPPVIDALDRALWMQIQGDFVPHASAAAPEAVRRRSPIVMGPVLPQEEGFDVLLNLTAGLPPSLERFDRVIELVGSGPGQKEVARERWRQYRSQGLEPVTHDLGAQGQA